MAWAWRPRLSTVLTTRATSSAVAAESMTMSMGVVSWWALSALSTRCFRDKPHPRNRLRRFRFRLRRRDGVQHQIEGRIADLRPQQVRGEGRQGDHHAPEWDRDADRSLLDRHPGHRAVQQ